MGQERVFKGEERLVYEVKYESERKQFTDTITIILTNVIDKKSELFERVSIYQFNSSILKDGLRAPSFSAGDSALYSDQDKVFSMNPPLYRYYHILELAPIPRVEYPLFPNKNYSFKKYLGKDWGSWSGSKVNSTYRVIHNTSSTWRIQAESVISSDESFTNKLFILFNSKEGFLELYYEFADGTMIEFSKI